MTDKDKVIKGLTHCTAWAGLHECQPKVGDDCPYVDESDCKLSIMYDALAVLKEQEKEIKRLKLGLKEQENEYEKGFNDAMIGKQDLMYEGVDGKWHKKDW